MSKNDPLFSSAALLLATVVLSAAVAHSAYVAACVCVINSAARAAAALGVSLLAGVLRATWISDERGSLWTARLQGMALLVGVFFLVQHVFFVLQLA
ncbi:MAG: hypothetical protein JNJ64_15405 [Flavobacteriales bacterium]|nr:hypothetical protein [Flavobacteriales bacterium]